jgi:hypothetical protein
VLFLLIHVSIHSNRRGYNRLANEKHGISPEWPCGFPGFSAAAPKAGIYNRRNMTLLTSELTG